MQLLERDQSLAALMEYARDARAGDGRVVLICGEAGVGKSSLLEQFQREAADARWACGACDGLFTPRPLGPLFDIAEQLGGELLEACRRNAPRDELFAALLRQISEPDPLTVLSIEDVHWADESTLDLLRFLGRRIRTAPAMLVVTYRDDALARGDPLRVVLGALAAERAVRRVNVGPLSEDAVGTLAVDSGIPAAELHRLTGGNPFFVTEVVQAGSPIVPASARDAVLSRVAGMSESARKAVEVAALGGARVEPRLLAAAGNVSASDLDELLASGVLVSEASSLRFRHEITRLAVEREIPAHRGASISAGLLHALRQAESPDDARLAFHAEGAEDREAVLLFAPRAGQRAAELGSHREAATQFQRALRFADIGTDPSIDATVVAELNDRLAWEASLIDGWQLAAVAGERALAVWREVGDPVRVGDTVRALSRTMWRLCRGRESLAYAEEAVSTLEPLGATAELVWAYAHLAAIHMHRGERECGAAGADKACSLAETFGLAAVITDGLATEPCFARASGENWQHTMRRSLRAALDSGVHQQAARVYANLALMLCASKQFTAAGGYVSEGMAFCEEHDIATFGVGLQATRGELLLETGRWDEALAVCQRVLDTGASPRNRITPALVVGRVLARRGDQAAWPHLNEAISSADGAELPSLLAETRPFRAEANWLTGNGEAATRDIAVGAGGAAHVDEWIRGLLATWQRRLGVEVTVPTDRLAEPYQRSLAGDFCGAAEAWDMIGSPYDAALALYDSGSEAGLREALRRFDALGAAAPARAARREMRRLGLRAVPTGPHPGTRAHPAGLTRREREVLRLVCAGHTNAEISDRLIISRRTVDHHVSSVMAKLGVTSRRAAAEAARRLELLDPSAPPGVARRESR